MDWVVWFGIAIALYAVWYATRHTILGLVLWVIPRLVIIPFTRLTAHYDHPIGLTGLGELCCQLLYYVMNRLGSSRDMKRLINLIAKSDAARGYKPAARFTAPGFSGCWYVPPATKDGKPTVYPPQSSTGEIRDNGLDNVLLYIHGGAYVCGCADQFSPFFDKFLTAWRARTTAELSVESTHGDGRLLRVLSIEYPLAPENPYPAALDSVLAAYRYVLSTESYAYDGRSTGGIVPIADRVFVAGDSAGGALALALGMKINELGLDKPRGVMLVSPWVDAASAYCDESGHAIPAPYDFLRPAGLRRNITEYMSAEAKRTGQPLETAISTNPHVSPLRAAVGTFADTPTTLFVYATHELFATDIRRFVTRYRAETKASVSVIESDVNAIHDWMFLPDYFGATSANDMKKCIDWMYNKQRFYERVIVAPKPRHDDDTEKTE